MGGGALFSLFQWLKNFSNLISPAFLFVSGDSNYRHCIPYGGVLGTISAIPIFYGLRQKIDKNMKYMIFIAFLTLLSTALTNEGMPHSLRSCLAWMPCGIFISFYWQKIIEKSTKHKILCLSLMLIFFALYFATYMKFYINLGKHF